MVGGLCAHNARAKLLPVRSYALRPILHAKPVTISQERPRFASRLNPGPATNVAPLAPPYSTTARRRWAPAAMQQKGQPRSAKTKPSRAEDSLRDPTQAPRPLPGAPTSISLEAKRFGRWPPRTTGLPTTESKGETKDEAQQRLPASAFVLRGTAAPLGVGCWSFRSARRRGGSRRADCLSLSSERTMGLAEKTARSNASRAGTRCPPANPSACAAPRLGTSRSRMPIGFNALGGGAPRSTPRASTPTRSAGSATAGWSRRCKIDRGCSCTSSGFATASAALRLRWLRRRGAWLGLAVAVREKRVRRAQAPRVPRQVPAARQDLRVRERRRPQVEDHDPVDFRTHERKTKTHSEVY